MSRRVIKKAPAMQSKYAVALLESRRALRRQVFGALVLSFLGALGQLVSLLLIAGEVLPLRAGIASAAIWTLLGGAISAVCGQAVVRAQRRDDEAGAEIE